MRLTGEGRELGVRWDPPGAASLGVVGLKAGDFAGWLPPEVVLPEVSLESVSVRVEDFEPVLIAETAVRASWRPDAGKPPIQARVRGRLDESGVKLAEIRAAYDDTPVLSGELTLPVTLHPWSLSGTGSGALPAGGEETAATAAAPGAGGGKDRLWRIVSGGELGGSIAGDWSAELRELIHDGAAHTWKTPTGAEPRGNGAGTRGPSGRGSAFGEARRGMGGGGLPGDPRSATRPADGLGEDPVDRGSARTARFGDPADRRAALSGAFARIRGGEATGCLEGARPSPGRRRVAELGCGGLEGPSAGYLPSAGKDHRHGGGGSGAGRAWRGGGERIFAPTDAVLAAGG